jgi:hypothetical protein
VIEIREYLLEDGSSPFGEWFKILDGQAAAKVTTTLSESRMVIHPL